MYMYSTTNSAPTRSMPESKRSISLAERTIIKYEIEEPLAVKTVHELTGCPMIQNPAVIMQHLFTDNHANWEHFLSKFMSDERHKALCVLKDVLIFAGSEACIECWSDLLEIAETHFTFSRDPVILTFRKGMAGLMS